MQRFRSGKSGLKRSAKSNTSYFKESWVSMEFIFDHSRICMVTLLLSYASFKTAQSICEASLRRIITPSVRYCLKVGQYLSFSL